MLKKFSAQKKRQDQQYKLKRKNVIMMSKKEDYRSMRKRIN